jgi:dephospho-CoA kinase
LVIIESAILFESDLDKITDVSVNVSAPLEMRIERTQKRDQIKRELVLNRIHSQISEEERNNKSDYIIINDNYRAILPQVEYILEKLNY